MEDVPVEVLRRPYTRSIPPTLRSVSVLEASFLDVKQQWHALFLEEVSNTTAVVIGSREKCAEHTDRRAVHAVLRGALTVRSQQALRSLARLTGQLKAVKQELIAHRSHDLSRTATANTPTEASTTRHVDVAEKSTVPSSGEMCDVGSGSSSANETVAFFVGLLAEASPSHKAQALNKPHESGRLLDLCRRVWLWTLFFSLLLSDMELLSGTISYALNELWTAHTWSAGGPMAATSPATARSESQVPSPEWCSFVPSLPSPCVSSHALTTGTALFVDDHAFVHGCAVIYEAFISESHPSDSCAREWSLLEPWLTRRTDAEEGGKHSRRLDEMVEVSATSTQDDWSFTSLVTRAALAAIEHDAAVTSALIRSLSRAPRMPANAAHTPTTVLVLVVQLMVRLLTEMLVRPQWSAMNMQNTFRPIPSMETVTEPEPPRTTVAIAWEFMCENVDLQLSRSSPPASTEVTTLMLNVWQLSCLERFCVPWPVPEPMLHTSIVV